MIVDTATPIPGEQLAAAGVTGVFRYLSYIPGPKIVTQAEVADLHAHGIALALVYEDTTNDMGAGLDGGVEHGKVAVYEAATLGAPPGTGIYFACDSNQVQPGTRDTMCAAAFVADHYGYRPGWYGRADTGRMFVASRTVNLIWAVDTWPGGQDLTGVNVIQRANHPAVVINGVWVDYDDQITADYGQWAA